MSTSITRETITPERAQELLATLSPHQRRCTKAHAAMLARDMEAGLWDEDVCAPIQISDEGNLLDGQHRMAAVVLAGVPVTFFIARGVPEKAFSCIDIGKRRAAGDFYEGPNGSTIVSIARCVGAIEAGADLPKACGGYVGGASKRLSDNEVLLVVQRNEEELQAAFRAAQRIRSAVGYGATTGMALAVYVARACGEPVDDFVDDLAGDMDILTVRTVYRRLVKLGAGSLNTLASRTEACGVLLYGIHAVAVGNRDVVRVQEPVKFLAKMSDYYTAPIREAAQ